VRRPLRYGPKIVAASVMDNTNVVAAMTRTGISHLGSPCGMFPAGPDGKSFQMITKKTTTPMNAKAGGTVRRFKSAVTAKNARQQPPKLKYQLNLNRSQAYTMADTPNEITPIKVPSAASAAKPFPCSIARNKMRGPDVRGKPRIMPPIEGPQRLATSLTIQIRTGTLSSLNAKKAHGGGIMATTEDQAHKCDLALSLKPSRKDMALNLLLFLPSLSHE